MRVLQCQNTRQHFACDARREAAENQMLLMYLFREASSRTEPMQSASFSETGLIALPASYPRYSKMKIKR